MRNDVVLEGKLAHLYEAGMFDYEPEKYEWLYFGHLSTHDYVYGILKLKEAQMEQTDAVFVRSHQPGVSRLLSDIVQLGAMDGFCIDVFDRMIGNISVGPGTHMQVVMDGDVFIVDHDTAELCYYSRHAVWMVNVDVENGVSCPRVTPLSVV